MKADRGSASRIFKALIVELRERGCKVNRKECFTGYLKEHEIGLLIPDLIVDPWRS